MLAVFIFACATESSDVAPANKSPEISIFFPDSEAGGEVDEGIVLFKAKAIDEDLRDQGSLIARWFLDDDLRCNEVILHEKGETSCSIQVGLSAEKISVEVEDLQGVVSRDEYLLSVKENELPSIRILKPQADLEYGTYRQDLPFWFEAQVSDPNETAHNLEVSWYSSAFGDLGITGNATVSGLFVGQGVLQEGEHLITATVADSLGAEAVDSVFIVVGPRGIPEIEYVYIQDDDALQITEAFDTQTISCIVSATDPYDEDLTYSYQWFNQAGEQITEVSDSTQLTLNYAAQNLAGEETIYCRASVQDSEFTVIESASVSLLACSPLHMEIPYDGLDSNCDGLEFLNDQNRDGIPDNPSEDYHDSAVQPARLGVECYGELLPSGLSAVYYLICDNSFHWKKSQDFCVDAGYDSLATMHTEEEFQSFSSLLSSQTSYLDPNGVIRVPRAWVGFTRGPDCFPSPDTETGFTSLCTTAISDYYWVDSGSDSYVNPNHWWNGQGTNNIEHCVELYWENGEVGFSDLYCDVAWLQPHYTPSLTHTRPASCVKRWQSAN